MKELCKFTYINYYDEEIQKGILTTDSKTNLTSFKDCKSMEDVIETIKDSVKDICEIKVNSFDNGKVKCLEPHWYRGDAKQKMFVIRLERI